MNDILRTILFLSLSGSVLTLLLLAVKPFLKNRVSKAFSYYIWLLVLLRLIVPVSSPFNFMGTLFHTGQTAAVYMPAEQADIVSDDTSEEAAGQSTAATDSQFTSPVQQSDSSMQHSFQPLKFLYDNLVWLWLAGSAASLGWFLFAYLHFARSIKRSATAPHVEDVTLFDQLRGGRRVHLICSSKVSAPMLMGIFHPMIVLPPLAYVYNGMGKELQYMLLHELTHFRRKDVLYKWLVIAVTSLHWFNPLMWLIRREINRACELSCDESVIRTMTPCEMRSYGNMLLSMASNTKKPVSILATTLCEGKEEMKRRLQSIMQYKKKSGWVVALTLLIALAVAGCGATLGVPSTVKVLAAAPIEATAEGTAEIPAATSTPQPTNASLTADLDGGDLDGDGLEDIVHLEYTENACENGLGNLHVGVTMGSGRAYEGNDFPGSWFLPTPVIADMNGDGRDDIVLPLENNASTYGAVELYVLRIQDDALSIMSFGVNYIKNDSIDHLQPESFFDDGALGPCVGANVIQKDGKNLLRVRHLKDRDANTAWYLDTSWNGEGWYIESISIGPAYGDEF